MDFLKRIADLADFVILRALPVICGFMLVLMVVFIAYTVVMRTVFLNPPFWGDTLALFANVWMVFLGLIIAVRERSNIAMEALYQMIPARYGRLFRKLWALVFAGFGLLLLIKGHEAASRILGSYWELGNLPKSYPMMILPITGAGILVASLLSFVRPLDEEPHADEQEFP
ncbi:TRAP transporter small permease [Ruegeria pomeroyi]|uniref:TRAP transporter small permease protein n=1 Tax=Ruegeria pomeroyi TaxID=89184 RepID=A0A9Q3WME2_9RHOB|nr:TRAP transporter small permease [Ruegeria pomeroyi]MCE8516861.1 TRAP transporter small permease [Ruegeria pomeroyi]MCE8538193.1 TRAP transporter small permease [Ruegeria pomeroyi]MCE8556616.1 TRAP transporter small permease [Ruegeria pomeroyi]